MFVLVEMVDTVRIPPWQFERKLNDSIAEELNKKLANKVVYNVGLCICLFDITKLEDAYVFPGDGASHTKVHFRYVVFHPFLDEILIGKIKGCSPEGVHVSLGFFDDILIPPESLQQPAKFDEAEQVWVWEYETEEGAHDLYMDTGEEIRFRVVDESFVDTSPTGPSSAEATSSSEELPRKEAPYTLVRSSRRPGASQHSQLSSCQEGPVGLLVPPQILVPGQAPYCLFSGVAWPGSSSSFTHFCWDQDAHFVCPPAAVLPGPLLPLAEKTLPDPGANNSPDTKRTQ